MKSPSVFKSLDTLLLSLSAVLSMLGLFFIFEASSAESYQLVGHQYHFLRQQIGRAHV